MHDQIEPGLLLQALQNPYISIYNMDVTEYTYQALYLASWINYVPKEGEAADLLQLFLNHSVYQQYHPTLQNFLSQEAITQRFQRDQMDEVNKDASTDFQIRRHGEPRWMRLTLSVVDFHEDGSIHHVLVMLQDITDDKNDAALDQLTDVYNRDYGVKLTNHILTSSHGKGRFIILDIDFFKQVNDHLGHQKGDEVLVNCANVLKQSFHDHAIIFRLGGDEFVVFEQLVSGHVANLDEIRRAMEITYERANRHVRVSASFGVVDFSSRYHSFDELYAKADRALYISKEKGRNVVTYYSEEVELRDKYDRVVQRIEKALKNQHIEVYYQPIMRSITGQLCDVEALVRWRDPELGIIPPDRFINLLEEQRMIHLLDLHVIETVCHDLRTLIDQSHTVVPVSVNLSRNDFVACDIFEEIEKIMTKYDIPRDLLNIEITESVFVENAALIYQSMLRFQEVGYQVWMDDFGSGFSNLNMLREYPFDLIKLDMDFLRNFDRKSKIMLTSVVKMAKDMGIRVLTEGVETLEQYTFLRQIGCERAQGYYFSKPIPLQELLEKIEWNIWEPESAGWRVFYDKLGYIDFTTDQTLAIVELSENDCKYMFVNDPFIEVCRRTGMQNFNLIFDSENGKFSEINQILMQNYDRFEKENDEKDFEYYLLGQVIHVHCKYIFHYRDKILVQIGISNMTLQAVDEDKREIEDVCRKVFFSSFDATLIEDLQTNTVKSLRTGINRNPELEQMNGMTIEEFQNFFKEKLIYHEDRKAYEKWTSEASKDKYVFYSQKKFDGRFFRTKIRNGDYVWKIHQMLYDPIENAIIYTTNDAPYIQDSILNQMFLEKHHTLSDQMRDALMANILQSKSIRMFWKDENRRFLGANHSFLETYGFQDESEIIGKTDEEMGWHIDDIPFKEEEMRVIKEGYISANKPGKCIVKGVAHDILATKEPIYRDGKIVGLFGYFHIMDEVSPFEKTTNIEFFDEETQMLTAKGMMHIILDYVDAMKRRAEKFAVIHLTCSSFDYLNEVYGSEVTNELLHMYAEQINDVVGTKGNCARLYASHFMIVMKYEEKDEVLHVVNALETQLSSIHAINDFPVTQKPDIEVKYSEKEKSLKDLVDIPFGMDSLVEKA